LPFHAADGAVVVDATLPELAHPPNNAVAPSTATAAIVTAFGERPSNTVLNIDQYPISPQATGLEHLSTKMTSSTQQ